MVVESAIAQGLGWIARLARDAFADARVLVLLASYGAAGRIRLTGRRLAQRLARRRPVKGRVEWIAGCPRSELEAFESPEPVVHSETPLSSAIESPRLSLAPPESVLEAPSPLNSSREMGTNLGRRRGNGDRGNWGAGNGDGFGVARFGNGGELVRGVAVKVGDPQFTLIWDTKSVDIDLHVIEPKGDHLYFGHRNGGKGVSSTSTTRGDMVPRTCTGLCARAKEGRRK